MTGNWFVELNGKFYGSGLKAYGSMYEARIAGALGFDHAGAVFFARPYKAARVFMFNGI